jgi:hypothetical protein
LASTFVEPDHRGSPQVMHYHRYRLDLCLHKLMDGLGNDRTKTIEDIGNV